MNNLILHYQNTIYRIYPDKNYFIDILCNQVNESLDEFLFTKKASSWVFITAYNPLSERIDEEINLKRNYALKQDLEEFGYSFFEAEGIPIDLSKWEPEKSFLALDISDYHNNYLGKKYQQNCVLRGKVGSLAELFFFSN